MDYSKAFTFVFEDSEWFKKLSLSSLILFIASLCLVIPAILYLIGYQVIVGRNVYKGVKFPLPDPNDFMDTIREGAVLSAVMFAYSLPSILLSCLFVTLLVGAGGAVGSGAGGLGAVLGTFSVLVYCLYFVLAFVMYIFVFAGVVQYIREGTFMACMQINTVWQLMRKHAGDYILIILCIIATTVIGQIILLVFSATILGVVFVLPVILWQACVPGHLLGQLAILSEGRNRSKEMYYDELA